MIEQDVLDKNPHVQWDDIAELKEVRSNALLFTSLGTQPFVLMYRQNGCYKKRSCCRCSCLNILKASGDRGRYTGQCARWLYETVVVNVSDRVAVVCRFCRAC